MGGLQSTAITDKLAEHLRRGELLDLAPDRLQRYHQARIRPLAAANPGVGDDRRADRMADMSPRPRHTITEIEKLLRSLESQGWRVEKGRKYFKAYCPCGLHKRTVHLTPSTASYLRNLVGWLGRETCWEEGRP